MKSIFGILWRLAVLALPWQTRWFADASLAGWPWEQGRLSFYASWFLIAATVAVGLLVRPPVLVKHRSDGRPRSFFGGKWIPVALGLLVLTTLIACIADRDAWKPVLQWWMQISVLALFVWTVVRAGVSRRTFAAWFVLSLIPHVLLGYWQYAIQKVIGSPWLGIATQMPQDVGVSVIEHGLYRVLRMYGGFPHPNVFAGWMAIGLVLALWLASTSPTKWRALFWSAMSASFSVAVLLSYARGAWIAAVAGAVVLVVMIVWTNRSTVAYSQYLFVALASSVLFAFLVAIPQVDHLATRFDLSQRLEAKSIETRVMSLREGLDFFRRHPLFGTGPNAELLDIARDQSSGLSAAPLEPPHDAYLLALADVGILGFLALAYLAILVVRSAFRRPVQSVPVAVLSTLAILALFDHYPWSLWSGQALVAVVLALIFSRDSAENAALPADARPS